MGKASRWKRIPAPLLITVMLSACSMGNKAITMDQFYTIPIGSTVQEMEETAGKPYSRSKRSDNRWEYVYVERFAVGGRVRQSTRFIFLVKDGRVVEKKYETESTPPYEINSYELQTSQYDQNTSRNDQEED